MDSVNWLNEANPSIKEEEAGDSFRGQADIFKQLGMEPGSVGEQGGAEGGGGDSPFKGQGKFKPIGFDELRKHIIANEHQRKINERFGGGR